MFSTGLHSSRTMTIGYSKNKSINNGLFNFALLMSQVVLAKNTVKSYDITQWNQIAGLSIIGLSVLLQIISGVLATLLVVNEQDSHKRKKFLQENPGKVEEGQNATNIGDDEQLQILRRKTSRYNTFSLVLSFIITCLCIFIDVLELSN